ncbi:MAG: hypothetical protein AAF499_18095, partial [Pseudomonadota bacterium]
GKAQVQAESTATPTELHFLRRPAFWLLAMGFSLLAIVHGAVLHHLLPILDESGLSADAAVLAASCIGPSQVAGRLAMVAIGSRMSNRGLTIASCCLIGSAVVLLNIGATTPIVLALAILCFGGAYGTISILRPLVAREILGGLRFGAKSGALALPYLVGSASAPFVGSLVWLVGGYDLLLTLLAILAVAGCLLYVLASRTQTDTA